MSVVDMEKIASDYLRTRPAVEALSARVVGKTPSSTVDPWVRVTRLEATNDPSSKVEHLIAYLLQLDCYAGEEGGQPEANSLGRSVRAALVEMPGIVGGAVVTSARIAGDIRLPDGDFEPARERVVLTARIHAHA